MQLDEIQALWAQQDEKLERSLRLNERLLREVTIGKTRAVLRRQILFGAVEIAGSAVVLLLLGSFISSHIGEPRFVVSAAVVYGYFLGLVGFGIRQLALMSRLDYGGPVTVLQRMVETIKLVEYQSLKWALLGGIVTLVLILIVALEAFLDVDVFANVGTTWVAANVAVGVALVLLGQWLSKKYVEHPKAGPRAKRFLDSMSGHRLRSVSAFLMDLSEFEHAES